MPSNLFRKLASNFTSQKPKNGKKKLENLNFDPVSHQKDLISVVLISVLKIIFLCSQSVFPGAVAMISDKGAILIHRGGGQNSLQSFTKGGT